MYENYRVYGPYLQTNGKRKIVILIDENGTRKTTAYARYLMECFLNRELSEEETIDHIDGNSLNDEISNLQILSRADNAKKHNKKNKIKYKKFICPVCSDVFWIPLRTYKQNQIKQGKAGPYCSRSCAGKAHH